MTPDTRPCDYCPGTMVRAPELGSRWYKCPDCGGTYDIPLAIGIEPTELRPYRDSGATNPIRGSMGRRSPSKGLIKEAARARQEEMI